FRECDLTNAAHTYALVTKENPEVIVHCAAYNNVDAAESHPEEVFRSNALATRNLALACQRFDATLISISTDYVFDGTDALHSAARRPTFSGLDNLAWRLDGFPALRSWKEALRDHFSRKKVAAS